MFCASQDMQMPKMDGLEATRRFRAWEAGQPNACQHAGGARRLPIVALSANVFDERIMECRAAGMDGALLRVSLLD
jgi:CheY-like chemotaxis protein